MAGSCWSAYQNTAYAHKKSSNVALMLCVAVPAACKSLAVAGPTSACHCSLRLLLSTLHQDLLSDELVARLVAKRGWSL